MPWITATGQSGQEVKKFNILIEEEDMTAKLQWSLLELHSFPVTAKAEKSWSRDTKEADGGGHFPAFKADQ